MDKKPWFPMEKLSYYRDHVPAKVAETAAPEVDPKPEKQTWYQRNREKCLAYQREYYRLHKEQIVENQRQYRARRREKRKKEKEQ